MIQVKDFINQEKWLKLRDKVIEAGGDNPAVFGGSNYGGYLLQQNPTEFSALVYLLQKQGPFNYYVEIGSASGGNLRFIYENAGFNKALTFDDMMHPHAVHQASNSWHFAERITRYVGDSHRPEASQLLSRWLDGCVIDCAFIDGDHSVTGVLQDFAMLKPHFSARSLIIFHDTQSIPDIGVATRSLIEKGEITPVAHFIEEKNPCGIMVARLKANHS